MKRQLLLISAILATTAAIADAPVDAQAQAATLLSRPHVSRATKIETRTQSPSPALDAHQSAAALLSGSRPRNEVNSAAASNGTRVSTDAQSQAAALLSGSRSFAAQTISRAF